MIKKDKIYEITEKLVENEDNVSNAFRHNLFAFLKSPDLTLNELSEMSDVPYNTLNSFLYGNSNNIRIDNAVKIAKALNVSIDELVGANTIPQKTRESLQICRTLPENDLYLIRWFVRYLKSLNAKTKPNKRYISVMELECNERGNLKITSLYKKVDITDLNDEIKGKVFFGATMPCEHYMPFYSPYDTLLIANDRTPRFNENSLIRVNGILHIAKRKVENGIAKYYSIRDGKYRLDETDIDELIGYIACKI